MQNWWCSLVPPHDLLTNLTMLGGYHFVKALKIYNIDMSPPRMYFLCSMFLLTWIWRFKHWSRLNVTYVREVVLKGCVERARVFVWTRARNHATFQNDFPDISYCEKGILDMFSKEFGKFGGGNCLGGCPITKLPNYWTHPLCTMIG